MGPIMCVSKKKYPKSPVLNILPKPTMRINTGKKTGSYWPHTGFEITPKGPEDYNTLCQNLIMDKVFLNTYSVSTWTLSCMYVLSSKQNIKI